MDVSIVSIPEGLPKWHLVASFLRLRKDVFIEKLDWQLYHADAMEFEQYDRLDTVYIIAHEGDRVLGGARLLRTDRTMGIYSYMLRDAFHELLPAIPPEVCESEPPQSESVWELTRFFSTTAGETARDILYETNRFLLRRKAESCLFLGPPAFLRIARGMGFNPVALGKVTGNHDGRFLAFSCGPIA